MHDSYSVERCDALEYLCEAWGYFPEKVPPGGCDENISILYFRNWRFMKKSNGPVVFIRCHPTSGRISVITREDLEDYKVQIGIDK